MISLIGTDDSEIPDDVIQYVLTLMQAHNTQQLNIGLYTPAEIMLMTSQADYIHTLNRSIPRTASSVLIHPLTGHWVTSYYDVYTKQVTVYDSLLKDSHCAEVKTQIKLIYGEEIASNIRYGNVTQQNVLPVYGVFAIAFATSLYFGKDPETVKYILKARNHLKSCLVSGLIQPVPSKQSQSQLPQNKKCQTQFHQEHDLLDSYFMDQTYKRERKRLLSDHNVSDLPTTKARTCTSNSSRERKIRSRQNPVVHEREKQCDRKRKHLQRQDKQKKNEENIKQREYRQKMRQNEAIRKNVRQEQKDYRQKRRQNEEIRKSERQAEKDYRQKRRQSEEIRKSEIQGQKHYRQKMREHENIRNMENRTRKHNIELKRSEIYRVIQQFKENCKQMPTFICLICYRQLFKKQVKTFTFSKYDDSECVSECLRANKLHQRRPNCTKSCPECARWICFTCDRYLLQNKLPNQASVNSLALPIQPPCLANLNTIEKHLITPIIPFMKIIPLPKGLQKGLHGPVVCVPSNLSSVTEVLPRQLSDETLVKVKLKRKLEYRGHHLFQQVSLQKLKNALEYLKAYIPYYKGNLIVIIHCKLLYTINKSFIYSHFDV